MSKPEETGQREYHAFEEISDTTIAAIIETGFMNLDRDILTQHPEVIAEGIVQGIECFVNNESVEPTPVATIPVIATQSP